MPIHVAFTTFTICISGLVNSSTKQTTRGQARTNSQRWRIHDMAFAIRSRSRPHHRFEAIKTSTYQLDIMIQVGSARRRSGACLLALQVARQMEWWNLRDATKKTALARLNHAKSLQEFEQLGPFADRTSHSPDYWMSQLSQQSNCIHHAVHLHFTT